MLGRRNRSIPRTRRLTLGAAAATTLAMMLLVISAGTGAAPAVTSHRPFTGATAFTSTTTYLDPGCLAHETASMAVSPFANSTTGRVGSVTHVNVTGGCTLALANLSTTAGFLGPAFKVKASATHTVAFHWRVSLRAAGNSVGMITGDAVSVTLFGNLYDNTTGNWVLAHDAMVLVFSNCCHFVGGLTLWNFTVSFHAGLVGGDQYLFYTGLHTFVKAKCQSPATKVCGHKAHAEAHIDLGLHGNGAWLISMKLL